MHAELIVCVEFVIAAFNTNLFITVLTSNYFSFLIEQLITDFNSENDFIRGKAISAAD